MFKAESIFYRLQTATEFTVTSEHLTLLRQAHVGWDATEFGAPAIDPKRPYGNSGVYADIAEMLDEPFDDEEDTPEAVADRYDTLHAETGIVLQIALVTGEFRTGRYTRDKYRDNWRQISD
jgi:hypothetical protein